MNLSTPQAAFSKAPAEIRYALILTLIMTTAGGIIVLGSIPLSLFDEATAIVSFGLLLLPYLLFASRHFVEWLRGQTARSLVAFPLMLLAIYLLYGLGPGRLRMPQSLIIPAYLGFPVLFASLAEKRGKTPNVFDWLTVLFLYLPVELSALALAWKPAETGIPSPSHPFSQLLGMDLALFCFLVVRPLEGMGLTFRLHKRDAGQALIAFGWFFPLALMFGYATGFVSLHPHLPNPALIAPVTLGITFMVALPEEIMFRGLLQNMLQKSVGSAGGRLAMMAVSSILFGLSHLNNHPYWNWDYVIIATVAGIAYGLVYNLTGKVTASAITHALVDIVHRLCF